MHSPFPTQVEIDIIHRQACFCCWKASHKANLAFNYNANTFLWSVAASTDQELSRAAVFANENRQATTTKFIVFQKKVCDKLFNNGVSTKQFQFLATNQFPPGECILKHTISLTEIF